MTRLSVARIHADLTQAELAKRANVSLRSLQDYEQGRKNINGVAALTVWKLAQALGCSMEDLLELDVED